MNAKKRIEDERKKLTFFVIFMSIFLAVILGLGPLI